MKKNAPPNIDGPKGSQILHTSNAPLPAHSHIITQRSGNWWGLTEIGVKDLATWNQIVAGKSLNAA